MANDVFFLTKHLILFVNVVLWFYFCLPSQCFVTTTKNKALVPIRTHTALPQLSGLISLSFSLFPLLSLHSYTSLAFSANSLPPRVFFLWILCWFPEIICSMNSTCWLFIIKVSFHCCLWELFLTTYMRNSNCISQ